MYVYVLGCMLLFRAIPVPRLSLFLGGGVLLIVGGRVVAKGRDGLAGSRVGGFRFIPGCRRRGPSDVDRG